MRVVDSASFNTVLMKDIEEINKRSRNISCDNIEVFNYVNALDTPNLPETSFSNVSMVNSIDISKINGVIRFLKTSKQKYLTKSYVIDDFEMRWYSEIDEIVYENDGSATYLEKTASDLTYTIDVPSGFDGRQAFVYVSVGKFGTNQKLGWVATKYVFEKLLNISTSPVGVNVYQTSNQIKIVIQYGNSINNLENGFISLPEFNVNVLYWRSAL